MGGTPWKDIISEARSEKASQLLPGAFSLLAAEETRHHDVRPLSSPVASPKWRGTDTSCQRQFPSHGSEHPRRQILQLSHASHDCNLVKCYSTLTQNNCSIHKHTQTKSLTVNQNYYNKNSLINIYGCPTCSRWHYRTGHVPHLQESCVPSRETDLTITSH